MIKKLYLNTKASITRLLYLVILFEVVSYFGTTFFAAGPLSLSATS